MVTTGERVAAGEYVVVATHAARNLGIGESFKRLGCNGSIRLDGQSGKFMARCGSPRPLPPTARCRTLHGRWRERRNWINSQFTL